MKDKPPKQPTLRGRWVELKFAIRALSQGLAVSWPVCDCYRFDCISVHGSRLRRVQVKSTTCRCRTGYMCSLASHDGRTPCRRYLPEDVDFIAAYIIPEDAWYILPIHVIAHLGSAIRLNPHSTRSKYQPYLEAWCLLKGRGVRGKNRKARTRAA